MLKIIAPFVLALSIVGCSSIETTPETRLAIACEVYAGTLNSLSVLRADGRLSDNQIERVDTLRPALNTLCQMDPDAPSGSAQVVESGIRELSNIHSEASK